MRCLQRDSIPGEAQQEAKFFSVVFWAVGNVVQLGKGATMTINDSGTSAKVDHHHAAPGGFGGALHGGMDKLGATGLGNFIAGSRKASKNTTRYEYLRIVLLLLNLNVVFSHFFSQQTDGGWYL